jgi:hypothetical protein
MLFLPLAGCLATIPDLGHDTGASDTGPGVSEIPGDTAPPADDTGGDPPDDYDAIFASDEVHLVDIELSEEALRTLRRAPKEYVEGGVAVDGVRYDRIGVRLKGSGSFQDLNGKAAFKLDFNKYIPEQSFHGKGKFTLNNMLHDSTQVHEVVAYAAFAAAGLPHARVGYAWVTVNGAEYGLYSNVETADRDYLDRNFGRRDGNLYEGGYPYYPDSWDHADFTAAEAEHFELESGTDVAWADVWGVVNALGAAEMEPELSSVVDLDAYARFQIVEAWAGQWDGYAFASNNFRIYFDHGGTGLMYMVPTGLDYCFTSYGGRLARASSPLGKICQADAACQAHFTAVLDDTLDRIDASDLATLRAETSALIEPWIARDPRNYVDTNGALDRELEAMDDWIATRSAQVRKWYGGD